LQRQTCVEQALSEWATPFCAFFLVHLRLRKVQCSNLPLKAVVAISIFRPCDSPRRRLVFA
jgi:hypothetical protein